MNFLREILVKFSADSAEIKLAEQAINDVKNASSKTEKAVDKDANKAIQSIEKSANKSAQNIEKVEKESAKAAAKSAKDREKSAQEAARVQEQAAKEAASVEQRVQRESARASDASQANLAQMISTTTRYLSFAAAGLTYWATQSAFEIDRQASEIGISRRELQAWGDTAEEAGVEAQTVVTAVGRIEDLAFEAFQDSGSEAAKTFRALGISVSDANGGLVDANTLLYQVSDVIKTAGAGTERTAKAIQLFGRAGRQLVPVLQLGGTSLRQMNEQFMRYGGGFSDQAIDQTKELTNKFKDLKDRMAAIFSELITKLSPSIEGTINKMHRFVDYINRVRDATSVLRPVLIGLGVAFVALAVQMAPVIGAWIVANAPLILFIAMAVLLALAIDDLIVAFEGGDSVIKDFIASFIGMEETEAYFESLKESFYDLIDAAVTAGNIMMAIFSALKKPLQDAQAIMNRIFGSAPAPTFARAPGAVRGVSATGPAAEAEANIARLQSPQGFDGTLGLQNRTLFAGTPTISQSPLSSVSTRNNSRNVTATTNARVEIVPPVGYNGEELGRIITNRLQEIMGDNARDTADQVLGGAGI